MDERELSQLAERFGTPSYVFDLKSFRTRLREVSELLGPEVGLCYSIKANPFLVSAAADEGLKLEVCSPGELDICERLGVDAGRVIYSGVCKREEDVREALAFGAGCFTAESPLQLELVNRCAERAGVRVPLLLRLNGGSQFGMSREDLVAAVARREGLAGVELVGVHYFVGTQRRKLKRQRAELAMLGQLLDDLERDCGWCARRLEYGPGLAVPYFEGEDFSDTLAPARELAADLRELARRVELTVEMGRFFASECGHYLTRVVDLKRCGDISYAFVDGGVNHVSYLGQIMGMKLPRLRRLAATAERCAQDGPWCLCGSLCTTADVLVRELDASLAMDDVLCFDNIGAYSVTEAMCLFLSRELPRVVLRDEDGNVRLVRDRMASSAINLGLPAPRP